MIAQSSKVILKCPLFSQVRQHFLTRASPENNSLFVPQHQHRIIFESPVQQRVRIETSQNTNDQILIQEFNDYLQGKNFVFEKPQKVEQQFNLLNDVREYKVIKIKKRKSLK